MGTRKTDNANLGAKLALRREMIRKAFGDKPIRVFDACQGSGLIWSHLRKEFAVAQYWGVDLKPAPGRMKIDSVKVLKSGVVADIYDIDTYGWPWEHVQELAPRLGAPALVFLTIGKVGGLTQIPISLLSKMTGISNKIPFSFMHFLYPHCIRYLLTYLKRYGIIRQAKEAKSANATYIGLWLEPQRKDNGNGQRNDHRMD